MTLRAKTLAAAAGLAALGLGALPALAQDTIKIGNIVVTTGFLKGPGEPAGGLPPGKPPADSPAAKVTTPRAGLMFRTPPYESARNGAPASAYRGRHGALT